MRPNTSDRCVGWPPYSRPDQRVAFESGIDVIETHMGPHHVAEKEFQHASAQTGVGKVKAKDGIVSKCVGLVDQEDRGPAGFPTRAMEHREGRS